MKPITPADFFPKLAGLAFPIAPKESLYIGRRVERPDYPESEAGYWEPILRSKYTHAPDAALDVDTSERCRLALSGSLSHE